MGLKLKTEARLMNPPQEPGLEPQPRGPAPGDAAPLPHPAGGQPEGAVPAGEVAVPGLADPQDEQQGSEVILGLLSRPRPTPFAGQL